MRMREGLGKTLEKWGVGGWVVSKSSYQMFGKRRMCPLFYPHVFHLANLWSFAFSSRASCSLFGLFSAGVKLLTYVIFACFLLSPNCQKTQKPPLTRVNLSPDFSNRLQSSPIQDPSLIIRRSRDSSYVSRVKWEKHTVIEPILFIASMKLKTHRRNIVIEKPVLLDGGRNNFLYTLA